MPAELVEYDPLNHRTKRVPVTTRTARICCDLNPRSMYGPFGLLRIVALLFALLAAIGACCLLKSLAEGEWWDSTSSLLLIFAAGLSATAAAAHEGLAKQVSAIAVENDKYALSNIKLGQQISTLGKYADRLQDEAKKFEGGIEALEGTLEGLSQYVHVEQLVTVIRAFTSADGGAYGDRDRHIDPEEVDDFLAGCSHILEKELPDFDIKDLRKAAQHHGISLCNVTLIISAMLCHEDGECPKKGRALLDLVLFFLEPWDNERLENAVTQLGPGLSSETQFGDTRLRAELERLKEISGDRRVALPDGEYAVLAQCAQRAKWPPPRNRGLTASRSFLMPSGHDAAAADRV
eukprot:gnl/TRDRNA2_/TRDRNA2_44873_c0_seq1.p1 gnl/TRDRNA2_/TRDRNA2_44873_c0~~gnl/TRDRNA2_/TRDRNA2_44873_c0_seq1.p1  ORF type:complete len:385 (-),score=68.98 gnl/TRDRNA2_/TRDRNA2_44873_c0_seq1:204-1250(-)